MEREGDRVRTGRYADCESRAAVRRELCLEALELLPEHEPAGVEHALDGCQQLRPVVRNLSGQIIEGNRQLSAPQ